MTKKHIDLVAGDAFRHELRGLPPGGGAPTRPTTWCWLDTASRQILAWGSAARDGAAALSGATFEDLLDRHGIPGAVLVDDALGSAQAVSGIAARHGVRLSSGARASGVERTLRALDRHIRDVKVCDSSGALPWSLFEALVADAVAALNRAAANDE